MYKPTRKFQSDMNREQARRQRENNALSLRRKDRENKLQNKRKKIMESRTKQKQKPQPIQQHELQQLHLDSQQRQFLSELPLYVKGCFTEHRATIFECTQKIRRVLSFQSGAEESIKLVIESGVVPRIIQFLHFNDAPELQFEAMWVLTNIASSKKPEYTANIVRKGVIPLFINILSQQSSCYQLQEQAIWALGNIAGDCAELRNLVLNENILNIIDRILKEEYCSNKVIYFSNNSDSNNKSPLGQYLVFLDNVAWTLSNLSREKLDNDQYKYNIIQCLCQLISTVANINSNNNNNNEDEEEEEEIINQYKHQIEQSIGWSFNYILEKEDFDNDNKILNWMNDNDVTKYLMHITKSSTNCCDYNTGAMRAIGSILSGSNDKYTSLCIEYGVIDVYAHNLQIAFHSTSNSHSYKPNYTALKEVCWGLSNITAGTKEQIECTIRAKLFPILVNVLQTAPWYVAKEAMWAIANASEQKELYIIHYLVSIGCINGICSFLGRFITDEHNNKRSIEPVLSVLLQCMENILLFDNDNNKYALKFEEGRVVEVLDYLLSNDLDNHQLFDIINNILEKYFDDGNDNYLNQLQTNDNDNDGMNSISFSNNGNNQNNQNNMNDSRQFQNQFGFGYSGNNMNNDNQNNNNQSNQSFNF